MNPRTTRLGLLALALSTSIAESALANRPLNTDTADTIAARRCQFEPYAGRTRATGEATRRFVTPQFNCGLNERSQLGVSLVRSTAGDGTDLAAALGGKTALVELKPGHTGVAVGYGLSALRPAGGSWTGEGGTVYGIVSREWLEGWLTHANLGWSRSRSAHQASSTYGIATEYSVSTSVVLSVEWYGDDRSQPWRAAGALWKASECCSVNVSYGLQGGAAHARQWTAGFLVEF